MASKVKYEKYKMVDGSERHLVRQVGDGSIIKRFDRTPIPKKLTDVVCPHFIELKWAYGCPFDCAWCFLKGTLRFLPTKTRPVVKEYNKIKSHLEAFFEETSKMREYPTEVLNTGEIADSLMWENNGHPFSKFILGIFDAQKKHKVLFLTKSTWIENLLSVGTNGNMIASFTLNAETVAKRWEKIAPSVKDRIGAAKKLYDAGYTVRVRIDPMVPIDGWDKEYKKVVDKIFKNFTPERITLGSLRGLQSTINNVKDKSWVHYMSEWSNWGRKVDSRTRHEMYSLVIDYLKKYGYKKIALCKETIGMWKKLGMTYKKIRCNCTI